VNELTRAIENDSIATLKSLIKKGIDLNIPILIGEEYDLEEHDEISPLFYAIRSHVSLAFIETMLENGVDIFQTDHDGISALDTAIKFMLPRYGNDATAIGCRWSNECHRCRRYEPAGLCTKTRTEKNADIS